MRRNQALLLSPNSKSDLLTYIRRDFGSPSEAAEELGYDQAKIFGFPGDTRLSERELVNDVSDEIPHIATRLQVSNVDLYDRYDRLIAEASLRINVALPLSVLFFLVIWKSDSVLWLRILATLLAGAVGIYILRQGAARLARARDVIIQSLVSIDDLQSRRVVDYGRQFHTPDGEAS